jgi:predicted RNase H-like nuclease
MDGMPGGWAVVLATPGEQPDRVIRVGSIWELFSRMPNLSVVTIDIPIGLLESYRTGGRPCDQVARQRLKSRASSVFPAPIRPVLGANSYSEACEVSRGSAPEGGAISRQCFAIVPKIKEVDDFLDERRDLRDRIFEVHPELCFTELAGTPMENGKARKDGLAERSLALRNIYPALDGLKEQAKHTRIPDADLLDATVACWTALRCHNGVARSLVDPIPRDARGLPMTMWT